MMVVGELGREHVKIRGLFAKSSLFSFFGKIIDKTDPRNSTVLTGRRAGSPPSSSATRPGPPGSCSGTRKAGAVLDTAIGEVLEMIGRLPGKSTKEIYALALRKASCEISCSAKAGPGRRTWQKSCGNGCGRDRGRTRPHVHERDGTPVRWQRRSWVMRKARPGSLPGCRISGRPGTGYHGPYHERKAQQPVGGEELQSGREERGDRDEMVVTVPFALLNTVADQGTYSVKGEVVREQQPGLSPRGMAPRPGSGMRLSMMAAMT